MTKTACIVAIAAWSLMLPAAWAQSTTIVRLTTSVGPIDIEVNQTDAPRTTANFLAYVRSGAYDNSFFHRLVRGFVLQGGGVTWSDAAQPKLGVVPVAAPIANEFNPNRSNLRGTVAMAKVDGNPDSATSQWFVNLGNNAANLDQQNGGFTVFGRVLPTSMAVVDAVAGLSLVNASSCSNLGAAAVALGQVPMHTAPASCETLATSNLAIVSKARELPPRYTLANAERVFDYLEAAYPHLVAPASPTTQQGTGFVYRYYPRSQTYLGAMNGQLYALSPSAQSSVIPLGALAGWLDQAASQGY